MRPRWLKVNMNNPPCAEEMAQRAASQINPTATFDPLLLLAIASLIVNIVNVLLTHCKHTPASSVEIIRNPNAFQQWRAYRIAKHQLQGTKYQGMEAEVVAALITTNQKITEKEIKECVHLQ